MTVEAADITYEFYLETYGGRLPEDAFLDARPAGLRQVRMLCGGREPDEESIVAYERAVCAAIDRFAECGDESGSFAVGDFRVTQHAGNGSVGARQATEAIITELMDTPLTFAGVRR